MLLMSNKLCLPVLKLTGVRVVHTFVDSLKVNNVMCCVYIRKCYMLLLGLKLTYAGVVVSIVKGSNVNQCLCCICIRMIGLVYV